MREVSYLAVLVPLDQRTRHLAARRETRHALRVTLWGTVAAQLKGLPDLSCILPAPDPWGQPLHLPFGTVLGTEEESFLWCYHAAQSAQQKELARRVTRLLAKSEPVLGGPVSPDTNVLVAQLSGRDRECRAMAEQMRQFAQGELTGTAGFYDLGRRSNQMTHSRERQILADTSGFALCVARLYPAGEAVDQ